MAAIVIRDVPPELHKRLKDEAARSRRSMNQQIIEILDSSLRASNPPPPPRPVRLNAPLTQAMLNKAIDQGRA